MAYYTDTDKIYCPHCGGEFYKDEFYPQGEELREIICSVCGQKYTISVTISYSFTTQCGNKKQEACDWQIYKYDGKEHYTKDRKKIYAECSRCKETDFVLLSKIN